MVPEGFADKIKSNVAQPGLLLQASDAPAGTTPPVFMLQVKSDGTLVAIQVAIGGGTPPDLPHKPIIGMPVSHVPEAPMDGQAYVRVNGEWLPIVKGITARFPRAGIRLAR